MARGWRRRCRGFADEAAHRVCDRPPRRGHSPPPSPSRVGYTNRAPRVSCSGRNGGSSSPSTASFITKVRSPSFSFPTELRVAYFLRAKQEQRNISFFSLGVSPFLFTRGTILDKQKFATRDSGGFVRCTVARRNSKFVVQSGSGWFFARKYIWRNILRYETGFLVEIDFNDPRSVRFERRVCPLLVSSTCVVVFIRSDGGTIFISC